jgi:hypothetical protein
MLTTMEESLESTALFCQVWLMVATFIKEQRPSVTAQRHQEQTLKRTTVQVWMGPPPLTDDTSDDEDWDIGPGFPPERGDDDEYYRDEYHYRNDGSDNDDDGDGGWPHYGLTTDPAELLALQAAQEFVIDSGAVVDGCPFIFGQEQGQPLEEGSKELRILGANGQMIKHSDVAWMWRIWRISTCAASGRRLAQQSPRKSTICSFRRQ